MWTWSIKMSVVDSSFSNFEVCALSSFHHFFSLDFSTSICKCSFLALHPLKSQKNNMKFRKINKDFWNLERYLHHLRQIFLQIKLSEQLFILYTANSFRGNFYFFKATTFFQTFCSDQIFDRLVCTRKICLKKIIFG